MGEWIIHLPSLWPVVWKHIHQQGTPSGAVVLQWFLAAEQPLRQSCKLGVSDLGKAILKWLRHSEYGTHTLKKQHTVLYCWSMLQMIGIRQDIFIHTKKKKSCFLFSWWSVKKFSSQGRQKGGNTDGSLVLSMDMCSLVSWAVSSSVMF